MRILHSKQLVVVFLLCGWSGGVLAESAVRVAVASNFLATVNQLVEQYHRHGSARVSVSSGSTGKLYAQIVNGAPFDIFLSADSARPERLEREGRVIEGQRIDYAQGKLALWINKSGVADGEACKSLLGNSEIKRVAMANPDTAPYGLAARQTMEKLGLWRSFSAQSRFVFGENIAQTLQYVTSTNAQAGFISYSQYLSLQNKDPAQRCVWLVPDNYFEPISQQAVLLTRAKNNQAALDFFRYLGSAEAKKIIRSSGYKVQ